MGDTKTTSLRKHRENLGLRPEEVAANLTPPMSWRTLYRWETQGVPVRRDEHRDSWLEQLAAMYGVPVETLNGNGKAA